MISVLLPQRLVLALGSDDIVLELLLCSFLTIVLSIFPALAFGGISLRRRLALALL